MTEEKKKEKRKSSQMILPELFAVQGAFRNVLAAQDAIRQNVAVMGAIKQAGIFDNLNQSWKSVFVASKAFENLTKDIATQASALKYFQTSQAMKTMMQLSEQSKMLWTQHSKIRDTIQGSMSLSLTVSDMQLIPSRTEQTIRALEHYIAALERELASSKEENKELRRRIEEAKKELKKQYVA